MAAIEGALGDAETVVKVGAGTGSYEPADRRVVALRTDLQDGTWTERNPDLDGLGALEAGYRLLVGSG